MDNQCLFDYVTEDRIHKHTDGEWYFVDEQFGCKGPFATREYAEDQFKIHLDMLDVRITLTTKRNYGKTVAPKKD